VGQTILEKKLATSTKAQGGGLAYRFCAKVGEKKKRINLKEK
jgi:hypothetical protein